MSTTIAASAVRVMDLMDETGHTSFGWDASDDDWVIPMIRRKMEQGFVFWIVERNPLREVRLERVEDLPTTGNRTVIVRDDTARQLFEQGRIGVVARDEGEARPVRRARTAEEAATNDTVGHRALRGG